MVNEEKETYCISKISQPSFIDHFDLTVLQLWVNTFRDYFLFSLRSKGLKVVCTGPSEEIGGQDHKAGCCCLMVKLSSCLLLTHSAFSSAREWLVIPEVMQLRFWTIDMQRTIGLSFSDEGKRLERKYTSSFCVCHPISFNLNCPDVMTASTISAEKRKHHFILNVRRWFGRSRNPLSLFTANHKSFIKKTTQAHAVCMRPLTLLALLTAWINHQLHITKVMCSRTAAVSWCSEKK